jgi:hypothetical protein
VEGVLIHVDAVEMQMLIALLSLTSGKCQRQNALQCYIPSLSLPLRTGSPLLNLVPELHKILLCRLQL